MTKRVASKPRAPRKPPQPKRTLAERSRKSSNAEVAQRILLVAQLLTQRKTKGVIKQRLLDDFGVGYRQAEVYISKAKKYLIARTQRSRDDHVAEAFAFYESIISEPNEEKYDIYARMKAQDAIRQLLGLDAPSKVAATTPDGKAIEQQEQQLLQQINIHLTEAPTDKLREFVRIGRELTSLKSGTETGGAVNGNLTGGGSAVHIARTNDDGTAPNNTPGEIIDAEDLPPADASDGDVFSDP